MLITSMRNILFISGAEKKNHRGIRGFSILWSKYEKKMLFGPLTRFNLSMVYEIAMFKILKFNCILID